MRSYAVLNPHAKYREPITVEDVLASRLISSPLHLLDCCMISDGGGALVLTSLERARDLRQRPVVMLGGAEAARHHGIGDRDLLDIAARQSGPLALERAGIGHADVDLCMVYDSYTITVLATLEALGFCAPGEGGAFCADGRLGIGGALPTNTDGGGLSSNHPGMRGIFLVIEATRQLRGERGAAQVAGARLALVHGTGGMLAQRHSGATLVLGVA
jgi:acetyl-CoA acetyltransferase